MKELALFAAIVLMCLAHMVRIFRWELFVGVYEKPNIKRLMSSLSIGYIINYFIPFKLGDIFKGFFAGSKMKNGKALGMSTVIVDRYLDIFSVGIIFLALALVKREDVFWQTSKFYIIFLGVLVAATILIYVLRGLLKKLIRLIASLFNKRLEISVMSFSWALIWNFKDIFLKINKLKLILYTVLMWGVYIASYMLFGYAYSTAQEAVGWIDVFSNLFSEKGVKASTLMLSLFSGSIERRSLYMVIYMMAPLAILLIIAICLKEKSDTASDEGYLKLLPQLNSEEKLVFLDKYFSNEDREYIKNYLKINHNISIVRDYSAGSNATTMLCISEKGMFFRKYAFGEAGDKLYEQIKWIKDNSDILPLPEVISEEKDKMYCYYDMPYSPNAMGMFEFVHSMPGDRSWALLEKVLNKLSETIYLKNAGKSSPEIISEYINKKVDKNLKKIKECKKFKSFLDYDEIYINGTKYRNLKYYEKWLNEDFLAGVFGNDTTSVVHGDLTIENIVATSDENGDTDYYIIDPNTGNVLDSPLLDYGKLLQSIHGGYEFLMAVKNVDVVKNHINFVFTRSAAYDYLHKRFYEYLNSKYRRDEVRSVYFHEIIHYLRLMPYKIEKNADTAPIFYAGMIMVLDDVWKMFMD
ncbi:MAG: flippase-like domain-containing protein [Lachnospiraceae bacterium]|nr:flippase-like domain-containing protein [Lachnospiraceae bacterium]